jgi:5-hydroxyisourate hydrolase
MVARMKRISTHILDLVHGRPAADVPVRLEKRNASGDWRLLSSTRTNQDGRSPQLLPEGDELAPGFYRLVFDVASYYALHKIDALYPVVDVTIEVRKGESNFHIPLLLSPNGYTTYRGS